MRYSPLVLIALIFLQPASGYAGESLFGYTFTTDTVPKGKFQVQQWYWGKYGKLNGAYANSLYRTQFEYGVTDAYQTALYINPRHIYARRNNRDQTTGGEDVEEGTTPHKSFNDFLLDTVSLENLYRVTSPVTAPLGTALFFESAFGKRRFELKPKVILQKNFLDDQMVWTANMTWGLVWRQKTGGATIRNETGQAIGFTKERWTKQTELEFSSGLSYRFRRNWSAGVEWRMHNDFGSFSPSDIEHTAFFLGPNLHFGGRNFWMTLTVLLQIPPAVGYTEAERNAIEGGRIFGNAHEAVEFRVKMGYAFN